MRKLNENDKKLIVIINIKTLILIQIYGKIG